ncbi:flagellin [Alphaproteobacteria bacterium]|nr:flagellin [Alphaproteobacteria bacterium]
MVDNINNSSLTRIRTFGSSLNNLKSTTGKISSGLKINDPKQNSSVFQIAQQLSGDSAGMAALKTSFTNAEAAVETALSAGQAVNDLLIDMKGKAIQASDPSLDDASRQAIDNEFKEMANQVNSMVSTASFGDTNLVQNGAEDMQVLTSQDGDTITVNAQDMSTQGLNIDNVSLATQGDAASALSSIDAAIESSSSGLADLGSSSQSIQNQAEFTTSMNNSINEGIGKMVDADLGQESASLAAERVKTELGLRSLAIANAGPQAMKSLFK